jgi:hypothetical protein
MKYQAEFILVTVNNCLRITRVVLIKRTQEEEKHPAKRK